MSDGRREARVRGERDGRVDNWQAEERATSREAERVEWRLGGWWHMWKKHHIQIKVVETEVPTVTMWS